MKIGLLSDTHGYFDPALENFFSEVDEIWHAGDIGNLETADRINAFKPLKAVYGNIDGADIRSAYSKELVFERESLSIYMLHIGGYPPRYTPALYSRLKAKTPDIFICGHSHILKIIYDKKLGALHLNPGAAGKNGFHKFRTALRFTLKAGKISKMDIWEKVR